jgi:lia operon protein LiaI
MKDDRFSYDRSRKEVIKMKKLLMLVLAFALIMVVLGSLGHMVALAISILVFYWAVKQFLKASSIFGKVIWGVVGLVGLFASLANLPALAGIFALYLLYIGYKHWKTPKSDDPFVNFEQQWQEIKKKYV